MQQHHTLFNATPQQSSHVMYLVFVYNYHTHQLQSFDFRNGNGNSVIQHQLTTDWIPHSLCQGSSSPKVAVHTFWLVWLITITSILKHMLRYQ